MVDWEDLTDEQKQAAGTLHRNVSLTAGAGTGKTTALTARYMQILRQALDDESEDTPATPEHILTTTFTERAANELKEEVREEIAEEMEAVNTAEEYGAWRSIADELGSGYIHTLHGFCARLLREHALESSAVEPGFDTLDEEETAALRRQVTARVVEEADREDDIRLLARQFTRSQLTKIIDGLLAQRPESLEWANRWSEATQTEYIDHVWKDLHPVSPAFARQSFEGETGNAFVHLQRTVAESPDIDQGDNMWEMAEDIVNHLEAAGIDAQDVEGIEDRDLQDTVNGLCDALTTYKGELYSDTYYEGSESKWEGHEQLRTEVSNDIVQLIDRLEPTQSYVSADIEADEESFRYIQALARLLQRVSEQFAAEKQRRNLIDYTDQIAFARRFIMEDADSDTRSELRKQFQFVMVDEFQDTDPRQWDIIRAQTSSNSVTFDAENVFVVGDTKQSIYRFRNADVTMFDTVADELARANVSDESEPGAARHEQLSENFRTLPNVLAVINELFGQVFSIGPEASFEASPQPLSAHRDDPADIGATVEYLCVPDDTTLLDQLYENPPLDPEMATSSTELEAEALAARLTAILAEERSVYTTEKEIDADPTPVINRAADDEDEAEDTDSSQDTHDIAPEDIAILLRSRTHLKTYERALSEADIPYTVASGLGFYETPEVEALINLLRVLVNPEDERALYGVLRSPVFGFTDDTIAQLKIESDGEPFWSALEETNREELAVAASHIESWRRAAGLGEVPRQVSGWADLLTDTIEAVGYFVTVSAGERPRQAVANVEKFREQLRSWDEEGSMSLPQLVDRLEERLEQADREGEADIAEDAEGVQIMTVHDAKGDEFPMVVVPNLDRSFMNRGSIANGKLEFETLPSGPAVGMNGPDPSDPMRETGTIAREGISRRRRHEERAEEKRILYVACTRARDHLLLSGIHSVDKDADVATEGLAALEPPTQEEANTWRDWVHSALLSEDVLDRLAAGRPITNSIGDGDYQVRLPEPAVEWDSTREYAEPQITINRPELTITKPQFSFSPSSLGKLLAGEGAVIYDEHAHQLRFRTDEEDDLESEQDDSTPTSKGIPANVFGDIIHKIAELRPPTERWHGIAVEFVAESDADMDSLEMDDLRLHGQNAVEFVAALEGEGSTQALHHEQFVTAAFERGEVGGFIDLLAVTDDGYQVVDYKTSSLDGTTATGKAEEYHAQLEAYAIALSQADPGCSVTTTILFTETGETVDREYSAADIAEVEQSLEEQLTTRLPQ